MRRVCNAASEFEGQSLNRNSHFIGPDVLQNLVGISFRFRAKLFGMGTDIEARCLQVQVPPEDAKCLRSAWRENQSDNISTSEYTRHIFGAKDSPTCSNYVLQRRAETMKKTSQWLLGLWNEVFYMDDFCIPPKISRKLNLWNEIASLFYKKVIYIFLESNQTFTNCVRWRVMPRALLFWDWNGTLSQMT